MKEGVNEMSCMRGQQTCPLYIKLGRQHKMAPLKTAISPFMTLLPHPAQNYLITSETTKKKNDFKLKCIYFLVFTFAPSTSLKVPLGHCLGTDVP